ncbi:Cardiolipin synthetase [Archangium violaceum]|uniref:phospholipase D-like domain-containing protein n=1 Tax=Archangium violaceum TaxID=83451 RepID=UPI00193B2A0F|nr:phospholipase D-like domain-containing protein [Archangium violaceum]QRK05896.1 Cardiolipin synthetase [Archangium violaceum]
MCNGRVFDILEEEIARARSSVHLAMYIWRPGEVSERLLRALHARVRAGVACRILVDAVGSRGGFEKEVHGRLERAGCEVRRFHPPDVLHPRDTLVRNHRKLLVVDGHTGLTGGWCIADEWNGNGRHVGQWRDTNVRVRGPAVAQMQAAFSQDWQRAGGAPLPPDSFPPLALEGPGRAAFVASRAGPGAEPAERMLHQLFDSARRRLWIASGYFILNDTFTRLLVRRKRAGVDVRILVPGPINDVPAARAVQRSTYRPLLAHGVRLWEYQPTMMHAKTAVVDEHLCVVGSTNLDPFALNVLEEGSLAVEDTGLNASLASAFLADLGYAREVHAARARYRPLSGLRRATWWVLRHFE